jgi:hypothetical protein
VAARVPSIKWPRLERFLSGVGGWSADSFGLEVTPALDRSPSVSQRCRVKLINILRKELQEPKLS